MIRQILRGEGNYCVCGTSKHYLHTMCISYIPIAFHAFQHSFLFRKDTFSVQCCDLGELSKVKVRHDNTGSGPSWLLDSVEVKCEGSEGGEGVWVFPCGQWLEVCDGCGGKLEVELVIGEKEERKTKKDEGIIICT